MPPSPQGEDGPQQFPASQQTDGNAQKKRPKFLAMTQVGGMRLFSALSCPRKGRITEEMPRQCCWLHRSIAAGRYK